MEHSTEKKWHANGNGGSSSFMDAIYDALIAGGAASFGTLIGLTSAGILADPVIAAVAFFTSFGMAFFGSLRVARGRGDAG